MSEGEARSLKVGAVQMESEDGMIEENLERATRFVEEATQLGAELVLLPEFMPTGYLFTKEIWDAGEPREGPTVNWLKENSKRLSVWLGTSFLEADGEDFFNTFVLAGPGGDELGRVRKQVPSVGEAFVTKGDTGPHVISTDVGLIGVGICYENELSFFPKLMHSKSPDIILMPHSSPSPTPGLLFPEKGVLEYNENLRNLAAYYARMFGVPVVLSNKCGRWKTTFMNLPLLVQDSSFPGCSTIADSDGTKKAQLGDQEGVIVEEVLLNPALKTQSPPTCHGRWTMDEPWSKNLFVIVEAIGSTWYRFSGDRKRRAKRISSGQ